MDLFVFVSNKKVSCVYAPESIALDKELFALCCASFPKQSEMGVEFVAEGLVTLRDQTGLRDTVALNPLALKALGLLAKKNLDLDDKM